MASKRGGPNKLIYNDWVDRQFVGSVHHDLVKMVSFLNRFEAQARYKLATVNEQLTKLERVSDFIEASLENVDPRARGGKATAFRGSRFDPEVRNRFAKDFENRIKESNMNNIKTKRIPAKTSKRMILTEVTLDQPKPKAKPQAKPKPQPVAPSSEDSGPPPQKPPQRKPVKSAGPPGGGPPGPPPPQRKVVASSGPPRQPPRGPPGGAPPGPPGAPPAGPPGAPPGPPGRAPPTSAPAAPPNPPGRGGPPPPGPPGKPAPPGPPGKPAPPGPPGAPPGPPGAPPANDDEEESGSEWEEPPMPELNPPKNLNDLFVVEKTPGDGKTRPHGKSKLVISYTGWLLENGECFDESEGFDVVLGSGDNIAGLERVLMRMTQGENLQCVIPSKLAYGAEGAGDMIPPNSDLVFDITLTQVAS